MMAVCKDSSLRTSQVGRKAHCQRNLLCLQEVPEDKGEPGINFSTHVHDEHFLKAVQKTAWVKRVYELVPGREKNRVHACSKKIGGKLRPGPFPHPIKIRFVRHFCIYDIMWIIRSKQKP